MPTPVKVYATAAADQPLQPTEIQRRALGERDVAIDIQFCGVCHSDIHTARNEWHNTLYPCVPGHEIVGQVTATGAGAKRFAVGDRVAVGCLVDSCRGCGACGEHLEQHCEQGPIMTYNSPEAQTGGHTFGGYAQRIVVDEDFVLALPASLDPAAAAPLLCAGITTYSPLRRFGVGAGHRVGVVGLGGLGHMALKFARAFGAHVVLFTHSPGKAEEALRLGASEVVVSSDRKAMAARLNSLDLILDTVSADHDLNAYLQLLKRSGTMVLVGAPERPQPLASMALIWQRRQLAGSLIGGIAETQEMLEFCAEHGIVSDIELIAMDQVNEAYERMLKSDVRYRFVIDMASL